MIYVYIVPENLSAYFPFNNDVIITETELAYHELPRPITNGCGRVHLMRVRDRVSE